MTRGDFRSLVNEYCEFEAQPYLTSDSDLNDLINDRLADYSRMSLALFDSRITFTLTANVDIYDIEGSAFGKQIAEPIDVTIDGAGLRDFWDQRRRIGYQELMERYPDYQTATAGRPRHWLFQVPQHIQLWPKPDKVYSNCFVTGWILHPVITSDNTELSLPGNLIRPAAKYVAACLIEPRRAGSSAERYSALMAEATQAADDSRAKAIRGMQGTRVRGKFRDMGIRRIGR